MKTEDFAGLKARYDEYTATKFQTKGAGEEALVAEIRTAFDQASDENADLLAKGTSQASDARKFDQSLMQMKQMKTWLDQLQFDRTPERKAGGWHPGTGGSGSGHKGYGAVPLVMPAEYLRELHEAAATKSYASKAITVTGTPMAAIPQYATDVFPFLRDKPRIRELIPTQNTDRPSVIYYRGLTAASAATAVAEGADKPESSPTWESVTVPMTKIAHYGKVNDEVIADFAGWMEVIGGEMLSGIVDAENDMLLNGTGTPPQFQGLLNVTGIQTQAFSNNNIETVALAATKLRTGAAFVEPDVVVMHPSNWQTVSLFRVGGSTTTDGPFLVNPLTTPALTLWGIPVVLTTRIAAGTALVANLKTAAEVYVRQDVTLDVHPGGGGEAEWKANKTLIRAEERIALTVPRPKAIVKLTSLT